MIRLIYGVPGAGKSTLCHDFVRVEATQHRFFIVDHADEWGRGARHWRRAPPSNLTVIGKGANLPAVGQLPPLGVFVFKNWEPLDVARLAVAHGNAVYVDDEIDRTARKEGWFENPIRLMVHQGRHLPNARGEVSELHVIGACRRPQNLASDLSELASEVFIFRLQGHLTLQRLVRDGHLEPDEIETARNLPNFELIHFPSREHLAIDPI